MLFMLIQELDHGLPPIPDWLGPGISILLASLFIRPLLRGFFSAYRPRSRRTPRGALRNAPPRPARNGKASSARLPSPFRLKDVYVIDGDTLARGDWRIRIYGMDAPESDQPGGPEATEQMKALVAGKTLHILPKDVDIYGRLVARVRTGSIDVGAEMVRSGHAVSTASFTKAYLHDEKKARRAKSGLWRQGKIQDPKAWRDSKS